MELIKEIGSRSTVSKNGKTTSRKWGLFKCPICGSEKEYNLQKGRTNKTCGSKGCRKELANYAPWNQGFNEEDKIKNLPYYSSFTSYYHTLTKKKFPLTWKSLTEFRTDMYDSYVTLKSTTTVNLSLEVSNGNALSKDNCKWVDMYRAVTDFSEDRSKGVLHSLMLAEETGIKHHVIVRTIHKMDESFGTTSYDIVASIGNVGRPTRAYTLNAYQYKRLKDRLLDNIKRKTSTYVYLIKCQELTKIGISYDVETRFSTLKGANAYPLTLLYSHRVGNATTIEKYLHNKYAEFNHHHEWFKLTDDQIKEIIAYIDIKNK